jgi:formate hydrogenlyase transcriptional activator
MQSTSENYFDSQQDSLRYEILLEMVDMAVHHGSLTDLFSQLTKQLQKLAPCDLASFSIHDPEKDLMRLHLLQPATPARPPEEIAMDKSPSAWVMRIQKPLVVPDLKTETRFPNFFAMLASHNLRSYCVLPMTTAQKKLGAMGLGSSKPSAYSQRDIQLLSGIADLVAILLENTLTRQDLTEEKERFRTLLEVSRTLVSRLDMGGMFPAISETLRKVLPVDYASLSLHERSSDTMRIHLLDTPLPGLEVGTVLPADDSLAAHAMRTGEVKFISRTDPEAHRSPVVKRMFDAGVQSGCCIPLISSNGTLGTLNLASRMENAFTHGHLDLLQQIASQMAIALEKRARLPGDRAAER